MHIPAFQFKHTHPASSLSSNLGAFVQPFTTACCMTKEGNECVPAPWRHTTSRPADCGHCHFLGTPGIALSTEYRVLHFPKLLGSSFCMQRILWPLPTVSNHSTTDNFLCMKHIHYPTEPQLLKSSATMVAKMQTSPSCLIHTWMLQRCLKNTKKLSFICSNTMFFATTLMWLGAMLEIFQHYGWHSWSLTQGRPVERNATFWMTYRRKQRSNLFLSSTSGVEMSK